MNIWKLLSALGVTLALFVGIPYGLSALQFMPPLNDHAWLILIVTAVGIAFKMLCGDLVSGEFYYYKHGYDFCVITFGASLSSFSLQLISKDDLFPGLPTTGILSPLAKIAASIPDQRRILLLIIFLISCLFALLTAYIARQIKDKTAKAPNLLSLINFACGVALFGVYVLLLITKK